MFFFVVRSHHSNKYVGMIILEVLKVTHLSWIRTRSKLNEIDLKMPGGPYANTIESYIPNFILRSHCAVVLFTNLIC